MVSGTRPDGARFRQFVSVRIRAALSRFQPLATLWKREDVERLPRCRNTNLRRDRRWHEARAAATEPRRHGNVLTSIDREGNREALHRRRESRAPQDFAASHVDRFELAIEIAHERNATGC